MPLTLLLLQLLLRLLDFTACVHACTVCPHGAEGAGASEPPHWARRQPPPVAPPSPPRPRRHLPARLCGGDCPRRPGAGGGFPRHRRHAVGRAQQRAVWRGGCGASGAGQRGGGRHAAGLGALRGGEVPLVRSNHRRHLPTLAHVAQARGGDGFLAGRPGGGGEALFATASARLPAPPPPPHPCRYTAFIPLYPVGVVGEMSAVYAALPAIRARGLRTVRLPNPANFAFDYATFLSVSLGPRRARGEAAAPAAAAAPREKRALGARWCVGAHDFAPPASPPPTHTRRCCWCSTPSCGCSYTPFSSGSAAKNSAAARRLPPAAVARSGSSAVRPVTHPTAFLPPCASQLCHASPGLAAASAQPAALHAASSRCAAAAALLHNPAETARPPRVARAAGWRPRAGTSGAGRPTAGGSARRLRGGGGGLQRAGGGCAVSGGRARAPRPPCTQQPCAPTQLPTHEPGTEPPLRRVSAVAGAWGSSGR